MMIYDPNTRKSKSVINWKVIKNIWIIFIVVTVLNTCFKEETVRVLVFIIKIIASILGIKVNG